MSNFLNFIKRRGDVFVDRGDPDAFDFTVASFTRDGAWHDLDLSSVVPSGASWVYVVGRIDANSADQAFVLRKKGNTNAYNTRTARVVTGLYWAHLHAWLPLDANRTIEYLASSAQVTEISLVVAGWIMPGDVNDALKTDGTGGRVLRYGFLKIEEGTNPNTLKCTFSSWWNADTIAETDNIAKGATTGAFTLNANGQILEIENTGLSGIVKMAMGSLARNDSSASFNAGVDNYDNNIRVVLTSDPGGNIDITSLTITTYIDIRVLYMTDA